MRDKGERRKKEREKYSQSLDMRKSTRSFFSLFYLHHGRHYRDPQHHYRRHRQAGPSTCPFFRLSFSSWSLCMGEEDVRRSGELPTCYFRFLGRGRLPQPHPLTPPVQKTWGRGEHLTLPRVEEVEEDAGKREKESYP